MVVGEVEVAEVLAAGLAVGVGEMGMIAGAVVEAAYEQTRNGGNSLF